MSSRKREVDPSCLMDCPDEDCDGILIRISLPSENPAFRCLVCGGLTWFTPEMQSTNLFTGEMIAVQVDSWSPTG